MLSKIDILRIVRRHCATLYDFQGVGQPTILSRGDLLGFIVFPILASGFLTWYSVRVDPSVISGLINALAIFGGFLFNLLVLFHGMVKDKGPGAETGKTLGDKIKEEVLGEIYTNISYAILLTLAALIALIVYSGASATTPGEAISGTKLFLTQLSLGFSYFFVGQFLFTLLMILKRMDSILWSDFVVKRG